MSITIPFVGATNDGSVSTLFGYIFGASRDFEQSSSVPSSLKTVIITGGSSIWNSAFYDCNNLTSIEIPNSVTSIGMDAFANCRSLTSIEIPSGVTSIGMEAFGGCSSLKDIYYQGTAVERNIISIESENESFIDAIWYYYSETEPPLNDDGTAYDGKYWHYVDGKIVVWTKQ